MICIFEYEALECVTTAYRLFDFQDQLINSCKAALIVDIRYATIASSKGFGVD